jgi:hypothetical protein
MFVVPFARYHPGLSLDDVFWETLQAGDTLATDEALEAVGDFTRHRMREDGLYRRIMPPLRIRRDGSVH